MQIKGNKTYLTAVLALSFITSNVLAEEKEPSPGFLIVGPASTPEYLGSDDYSLVPMVVSNFVAAQTEFEIEGLEVRARWQGNNDFSYGIVSTFDFGRDDEVENPYLAQFTEIDAAINLGGFVAYQQQSSLLENDNIELRTSILSDISDTHNGQLLTFTATYTFPMYIPWRVELELESTYASSNYMEAYFGVNAINARASGLAEYQASGSLRDITLNANIGLFLNPTWGGFLRIGATRLMGDAKDSPIVKQGSASQYFVGLGVFYRFGG